MASDRRARCTVNWVPASAGMTFAASATLSNGVIPAEAGTRDTGRHGYGRDEAPPLLPRAPLPEVRRS